jgi:hypothetical protein
MVSAGVRRVFVEDERRDGKFLRMTWHPDRRTFVVSTWEGAVCVGAARIRVEQAPPLIEVLAWGLADAAAGPIEPPQRLTLREHLRTWWRQRTATAPIMELHPDRGGSARRTA